VVLGFGRAEHAVTDQLGDERVILGQLTNLAAPDEERARTVANVGQERIVIADDQAVSVVPIGVSPSASRLSAVHGVVW